MRDLLHARSSVISCLLLVALALALSLPKLWDPVPTRGGTDSLFYRAQVYEVRGKSRSDALQKVFSSDAARRVAGTVPQLRDPTWVRFSSKFYRRRWLVPLIAAPLPLNVDRSMMLASIFGYAILGPLLFALLRMRFTAGVSLAVAAVCLLLPPVRGWAAAAMTDSWGLTLEVAAMLAVLLALRRGGWWIAIWAASMLALSFTRDASIVLLAGVGLIVVLTDRTRRGALILAAGTAASIPAVALFGAPLVQQLSWAIQGFNIPDPATWSFVTSHFPSQMRSVLRQDATYPGELSFHLLWYAVGAVILATAAYTAIRAPFREPYYLLQRGAVLGGIALLLLAAYYTHMRLELAFIPVVAVSLAFAAERALEGVRS
jgi:hypothetical protein